MVSVPARRAGVAYATGKGLSQRRACTLLGVGRSALHYCSTKLAKDTPVLARMAELAARNIRVMVTGGSRSFLAATVRR